MPEGVIPSVARDPGAGRLGPSLHPAPRSLATLGMTVIFLACHTRTDLPTFRAGPGFFVRRVTAEGNLKAVKATPLTAPMDTPGAMKIAWIADDGSVVKNGDVVVRFDPTDFEQLLL